MVAGCGHCFVRFDYTAQAPSELTLKEGDKICKVEECSDGWYKGTLIEKTGLIPEKLLKVRTCSLSAELLSTLEFMVRKEYIAKHPERLTIRKGDVIINVQETPLDNRIKGTILEDSKLFPDNYVKLNFGQSSETSLRNIEFQVFVEFTAQKSDELSIRKGHIITNVQYVKRGWNKGTLKRQCGLFSENEVKINLDKISSQLLSALDFVVILDYTSGKPDELTLRKGDIIRHVVKVSNGWNKGNLNGKIGLFQDNVVKVRKPSASSLSQLEFIATSDFSPKASVQTEYIVLCKGDVITNVRFVSDGLYQGRILEKTGMFPDNFVKIFNASSELLKNKEFIVTKDYTSLNPKKMSIKKGDVIRNVEYVQDGWYKGTKAERTGIFPDWYVSLCCSKVLPSLLETFEFEVIYDYTSVTSTKLSLLKGAKITNVQYLSDELLMGTVLGKTGIFPSNFVEFINTPTDKSIISSKTVTQEVQASLKEQDAPEELLCPVCFELPDKEIYQCKNGHTLCSTCIPSIQNCPQCRVGLKVEGALIRNRVAESLVGTFKARLS